MKITYGIFKTDCKVCGNSYIVKNAYEEEDEIPSEIIIRCNNTECGISLLVPLVKIENL